MPLTSHWNCCGALINSNFSKARIAVPHDQRNSTPESLSVAATFRSILCIFMRKTTFLLNWTTVWMLENFQRGVICYKPLRRGISIVFSYPLYRLHHAALGPERALLKFQNSRRGDYPAIYLPREVIHRSHDLSMTSA